MTEPTPMPILERVTALLMRPLSPPEVERANELIARVSGRVAGAYGVDATSDTRAWSVIAAAVERGMRHPSGAVSKSGGPFSQTIPEAMTSTRFTPDELSDLDAMHGRARVGSQRLRVSRDYLAVTSTLDPADDVFNEHLTGVASDALRGW